MTLGLRNRGRLFPDGVAKIDSETWLLGVVCGDGEETMETLAAYTEAYLPCMASPSTTSNPICLSAEREPCFGVDSKVDESGKGRTGVLGNGRLPRNVVAILFCFLTDADDDWVVGVEKMGRFMDLDCGVRGIVVAVAVAVVVQPVVFVVVVVVVVVMLTAVVASGFHSISGLAVGLVVATVTGWTFSLLLLVSSVVVVVAVKSACRLRRRTAAPAFRLWTIIIVFVLLCLLFLVGLCCVTSRQKGKKFSIFLDEVTDRCWREMIGIINTKERQSRSSIYKEWMR